MDEKDRVIKQDWFRNDAESLAFFAREDANAVLRWICTTWVSAHLVHLMPS